MNEAKIYLRQIKRADDRINDLITEKERLATIAHGGAIPISEKVQSSPRPDKMENAVIRMVELEIEIAESIDKHINQKNLVIKQIESLDDERYSEILFRRYVKGEKLTEMAEHMDYNYHWLAHLHGEALKVFQDKFLKVRKQPQLFL